MYNILEQNNIIQSQNETPSKIFLIALDDFLTKFDLYNTVFHSLFLRRIRIQEIFFDHLEATFLQTIRPTTENRYPAEQKLVSFIYWCITGRNILLFPNTRETKKILSRDLILMLHIFHQSKIKMVILYLQYFLVMETNYRFRKNLCFYVSFLSKNKTNNSFQWKTNSNKKFYYYQWNRFFVQCKSSLKIAQ